MIAQDISSKMHEKGLYLFCDKEHFKDVGGTSYQRSFFLARDFYNEYKDVIIESRKNNNINMILDKVGKENFEQLNDLINEFYSAFPEFTLIKVIGDLKEGKDTELTRKYNEIKEKRDTILNNMREYSRRPSIFNL